MLRYHYSIVQYLVLTHVAEPSSVGSNPAWIWHRWHATHARVHAWMYLSKRSRSLQTDAVRAQQHVRVMSLTWRAPLLRSARGLLYACMHIPVTDTRSSLPYVLASVCPCPAAVSR